MRFGLRVTCFRNYLVSKVESSSLQTLFLLSDGVPMKKTILPKTPNTSGVMLPSWESILWIKAFPSKTPLCHSVYWGDTKENSLTERTATDEVSGELLPKLSKSVKDTEVTLWEVNGVSGEGWQDSVFVCLGVGDSEGGAAADIDNSLSPGNGRRSHV